MLVLDTDAISLLQRKDSAEGRQLAARIAATGEKPLVTIASFEEQVRGWMGRSNRVTTPEEYVRVAARLRELLDDYRDRQILDFDDRAAEHFKRLKAAKVRIGTMDLRIAAIALANNATLITRTLSDFRKVPGLRAEDWTAPADR